MALLRSGSRLRLAVAALALIAAVAGASVLYGHRERVVDDRPVYCFGVSATPRCTEHVVRGWVAPTALALVVLGVAGAVGVLVLPRRTST
jgi:hypothetical protein